jgi:hypothetical protein
MPLVNASWPIAHGPIAHNASSRQGKKENRESEIATIVFLGPMLMDQSFMVQRLLATRSRQGKRRTEKGDSYQCSWPNASWPTSHGNTFSRPGKYTRKGDSH